MPARDLTADDVVDWLAPRQTVEILEPFYGEDYLAKEVLLARLVAGMVRAIARDTVYHDRSRASFRPLSVYDWQRIRTDDSFWKTADLILKNRDGETTSHFGILFDPQGIGAIIGNGATPPPPPEPTKPPELEQDGKRPSVAPGHLQAWFDFYRKVTKAPEDTEDYAWAHAKRCFPNNTVSRGSVRTLRGDLKRGPKKKPDAAK
jgi:hypothetical protein